ncbi:MAG: hypothetical protein Q9201_005456 [Fulgogasparrea decipioides]
MHRYRSGSRGQGPDESWPDYLSQSTRGTGKSRLCDDFPHLRRLTIEVKDSYLQLHVHDLPTFCDTFRYNIRGLDWIHIIGLTEENDISSLRPLVCKATSRELDDDEDTATLDELETVQTHITEFECASGWKNVTLWRGSRDSRPPFIPNHDAARDVERVYLRMTEPKAKMVQPQCRVDDGHKVALQKEQNERLLHLALMQVNHVPEDVALQQGRGYLRFEALVEENEAKVSAIRRRMRQDMDACPRFSVQPTGGNQASQNSALADYQMQLMLLEQQNLRRLLFSKEALQAELRSACLAEAMRYLQQD